MKTTSGKFSMSYKGVGFWNILPREIREQTSRSYFRERLIKTVLNKLKHREFLNLNFY